MAIWAMAKETTIDRRMERVVRYTKFANNPHGDGLACERITEYLLNR